jgi:hypothetical protein
VLNKNGTLTVTDPKTGNSTTFDPSTLPGFIGNFKCTSTNGSCQLYSVGKSTSGDFTYNYQANPSILNATGLTQATPTTVASRRMLRRLQSVASNATTPSISSPVMCVTLGSAVLFTVNSNSKSYPIYMKDSILNTNPDFDYGQFLALQTTINQGTAAISAFSFVFNQGGIYVFRTRCRPRS